MNIALKGITFTAQNDLFCGLHYIYMYRDILSENGEQTF